MKNNPFKCSLLCTSTCDVCTVYISYFCKLFGNFHDTYNVNLSLYLQKCTTRIIFQSTQL